MKLFAIGDLHLAGGTGKTMDRFGEHWRDHDRKIFDAWDQKVRDEDLVLVCGDTSWAMRLEDALPDLNRIGRMPGLKLLIKGNHDYWWQSVTKMSRLLDPSIKVVNVTSTIVNRIAVAGTRGWLCPGDSRFDEQSKKIYEREVGRLRSALVSLRGREAEFDRLIVALHYPPTNAAHESSGFTELIDEHGVDICVYGHLHGDDIKSALEGRRVKTNYRLVSADAVNFSPSLIDFEPAVEEGMPTEPIARCNGCGFEAPNKEFDDCVSAYHDIRCPRCGTTSIDTSRVNASYRERGLSYGWGDNNTLDRTKFT